MTIEGELVVGLAWDGRRVRRVSIRSTRPFAIARLLDGRDATDAARLLPRLYSVCAHAQRAASASALDAAASRAPDVAARRARSLAVRLETVQEYVRRLLIDDAVAHGQPPEVEPVAAVRRALAPSLETLAHDTDAGIPADTIVRVADAIARHVHGIDARAFLALPDAASLAAWCERAATAPARRVGHWLAREPALGASDVAPMPEATRAAIEASVLPALRRDAGFARQPDWDGVPVETGALARMAFHPLVAALHVEHGNGVVTRTVARLVELAALVHGLAHAGVDESALVDGWSSGPGEGVGTVQTARGLLVHRAAIDGGRVVDYAIVAPTEWNFHPDGALARGLASLASDDEAELARDAAALVQALDPCVACRVEIGHA